MSQLSLTSVGIVDDPRQIATNLIRIYNASNVDQSTLFLNNVKSCVDAVATFANRPADLAERIARDITLLFESHFTNVNISATAVPDQSGRFAVNVSGTYFFNGVLYNLSESFGA